MRSGFIRRPLSMRHLVLAAVVLALAPGAVAYGQNVSPAMRELARKAKAGENENGFCVRAGFPSNVAQEQIDRFKDTAVAGAWDASLDRGSCTAWRVIAAGNQGGRRCVRFESYSCSVGRDCSTFVEQQCKDRGGSWRCINSTLGC